VLYTLIDLWNLGRYLDKEEGSAFDNFIKTLPDLGKVFILKSKGFRNFTT